MKDSDLHNLLDKAVESSGTVRVVAALEGLAVAVAPEEHVLTIIANAGVHTIPQSFLRGEVYEASRGDWNASTEEALLSELSRILSEVVNKLRSKNWKRVYLIPTGHPVLSLQIKAMVYRILRLNTIDLYYKAGSYFEIDLDQRAIALSERNHA
ncbi:MAG: hypothetical protein WB729_24905 [Candidatus Sulfotelmatobacter sp.]